MVPERPKNERQSHRRKYQNYASTAACKQFDDLFNFVLDYLVDILFLRLN
jgi:hypothetical protein